MKLVIDYSYNLLCDMPNRSLSISYDPKKPTGLVCSTTVRILSSIAWLILGGDRAVRLGPVASDSVQLIPPRVDRKNTPIWNSWSKLSNVSNVHLSSMQCVTGSALR